MKILRIIILTITLIFASNHSFGQSALDVVPAGGEVLVDEESCTISWVNSSTFSEFDIELWNGTSCSWTTIATSVTFTTYSWSIDLESFGSKFRIKIQNSNDANDYAFSTGYFSVVEPPEQFNDVKEGIITESPELLLFPNPAMNTLNIQLQNHQMRVVHFWDMTGKLIYYIQNVNSQNCKTSLDELPSGEYFVECFSDNNLRFVRKLIISR